MLYCKKTIINLFNTGKLSVTSAQWYADNGYAIICEGGKVVDIVKEKICTA